MLSRFYNAIYTIVTGNERVTYFSIWYSGKEIGRYMSKYGAKRVIHVFGLTGVLDKVVEKTWWSKDGGLKRRVHREYVVAYFNGVKD